MNEAVGSLTRTVNPWTRASDHRLTKLMGYMERTREYGLVMRVRPGLTAAKVILDSVSDADHATPRKMQAAGPSS